MRENLVANFCVSFFSQKMVSSIHQYVKAAVANIVISVCLIREIEFEKRCIEISREICMTLGNGCLRKRIHSLCKRFRRFKLGNTTLENERCSRTIL